MGRRAHEITFFMYFSFQSNTGQRHCKQIDRMTYVVYTLHEFSTDSHSPTVLWKSLTKAPNQRQISTCSYEWPLCSVYYQRHDQSEAVSPLMPLTQCHAMWNGFWLEITLKFRGRSHRLATEHHQACLEETAKRDCMTTLQWSCFNTSFRTACVIEMLNGHQSRNFFVYFKLM